MKPLLTYILVIRKPTVIITIRREDFKTKPSYFFANHNNKMCYLLVCKAIVLLLIKNS